jgi:putative oxidoreductase
MLVLVGFGTRSASLLSSGSMAFAYFTVHLPHGILPLDNGGEEAAYFCWAFLLLAFTGPGTLSLSGLLTRGEGNSPRPPQRPRQTPLDFWPQR